MHQVSGGAGRGISFLAAALVLFNGATQAQPWQQYADIEQAGWSANELEAARQLAAKIGSAAIMIVDHGHVVAAWGNIDHPYKTASIRKSIYDATIGATHYQQPFDINASLADLNIDDIEPLSKQEKSATVRQLMTARSGVYHQAAYETRSNAQKRPPRMSAEPGSRWYYNNWDFNVICAAFQQLTGTSIERSFAERLAGPLGMEDFRPPHVFEYLEPRLSRYPALTFRLSARDLARIGQLYLQNGVWKEKQIVSADWVRSSTQPHTTFRPGHSRGEGNGYGRLWWIFPARKARNSAYQSHHRVAARGAGGQIMVLFPDLDLLVVHSADTDSGRGVSDRDGVRLMDMIIGARKDAPASSLELAAVQIETLSEKKTMPLRDDLVEIGDERRAALEGHYMISADIGIRLYQYENRLFAQPLGMQYTDVELFKAPDGSLSSPVVNVVFQPVASAEIEDRFDALQMTFRGQTQTGKRVE